MSAGRHAARHAGPLARLAARLHRPRRRRLVWVGMPGYEIPGWYTPSAPRGERWEKAQEASA